MKDIPYQITVAWSVDDEAYEARVPALRYCLAYGSTPEKAVKEVKAAAAAIIKVMEADGKPLPAVDTTLERLTALQPLLNLSAIAKAADISVQTLASKISRGTALTPDESSRIGKVFVSYGLAARDASALASSVLSAPRAIKSGLRNLAGAVLSAQGSPKSLAASVPVRRTTGVATGKKVKVAAKKP